MRPRRVAMVAVWMSVSLCLTNAAAGQSSLQVPIQFDFLNPSARSLAMGGAFVGLADDATAALVNPGGLIKLTSPEFSMEGRYHSMSQPFLTGGRLSGGITGVGQDVVSGREFQSLGASNFGPSFLSFVYRRNAFRVAAFRHELIDLDQTFTSRGAFQNHGAESRESAYTGTRSISITTYGVSAAYKVGFVSLGGGMLVERFKLGFTFDRYLHLNTPAPLYGVPDPTQVTLHFTQDGDDVAVGGIVGAIVPVSIRRIRLPFSVRRIPVTEAKIGVAYKRAPGFGVSSFSGGPIGTQQHFGSTFKVPDTFAVGGSMLFSGRLTVSGEYTRVYHSQLLDDYVRTLAGQGDSADRVDRFTIADANEIHAGAEYLLLLRGRPRIRAGTWYDPDHSVHYTPTPAHDLLDERVAAALSSGQTLWHASVGAMISIRSRLDVSAAVDHSSRSTVVSTSAIFYF